jgi:hypothetical protein
LVKFVGATSTDIGSVSSVDNVANTTYTSGALSEVVNNNTTNYHLRFQFGTTGTNHRFYHAKVTYTVLKVD